MEKSWSSGNASPCTETSHHPCQACLTYPRHLHSPPTPPPLRPPLPQRPRRPVLPPTSNRLDVSILSLYSRLHQCSVSEPACPSAGQHAVGRHTRQRAAWTHTRTEEDPTSQKKLARGAAKKRIGRPTQKRTV